MKRMNSLWRAQMLGLAVVLVSALGTGASSVEPESSQPAATTTREFQPGQKCRTPALSDLEIALDAARVADFKARRGTPKGTLTTINTYVHVIHDGSEGLIPERMIREQISVLNDAYARYGFRFELAPSVSGNPNPDYSNNAAWYRDDEVAYKTALKEGSGDDLNIYTNSGGGYLGYAYYPTIVGTSYDVLDGVVLAWGTLPGAHQAGISDIPGFVYNFGDTATHEVGHYLGLAHTFEGHCSPTNDLVADTPAERSPDFYCTVGRNSCKDGNGPVALDPIHNFMDYSDDVCLFEFSGGQGERMQIQWALYRQGH
jgi:hypothetical protein